MLKAERHKYIMTKLVEEQKVVTTDLALALDLSEDTIRRDLNELDSKKLLEKVYGGAVQVKEKSADVFDIHISGEEEKKADRHKSIVVTS
ncbi:DeoR family transcriptional regulator [Flavobacterium johnsoniae]|uniref:DeoR-like helix-turn-helix domain-containing protein n=1 Tax=Flavobacterium johnsoniae TaxID=986 RepID=A0A1M5J4Y4_FLAJO|nr:DeoR family transcriptional regulator [Flavobacterium johnsoniae]SHG35270.1 DeoR-like helix-turn-helix domain-containing protein [Flavobacterium johnsoniae]